MDIPAWPCMCSCMKSNWKSCVQERTFLSHFEASWLCDGAFQVLSSSICGRVVVCVNV